MDEVLLLSHPSLGLCYFLWLDDVCFLQRAHSSLSEKQAVPSSSSASRFGPCEVEADKQHVGGGKSVF